MDARDVIMAPRITEKSMAGALTQQYTFLVHPHATKTQIRHAVEELFKVNVTKVNTVNVAGNAALRAAQPADDRQDFRHQESHRHPQARSKNRTGRR